jgi:hypothetical protein
MEAEYHTGESHSDRPAEEAMTALTRQFCMPLPARHCRCGIDGPTKFDLFFESMRDDLFGHEENSPYKCWARQLYKLGLISFLPDDWKSRNP